MLYPRRTSRFVSLAGMLVMAIAPILARAELSSTSPFLPPQGQAVVAPTAPPPLELRGINVLENVTLFSIFDATAKKPAGWLKLNEAGPGFTIKSFDVGNDTLTVDYQGHPLKLVMKTPKTAVSAGPMVAASPIPVPIGLQTPGTTNAAPRPPVTGAAPATPAGPVATATTAADAARLKEWTDEIERRRNVRNTPAGTPAVPTTTPQNSMPGPQPVGGVKSTGPVPSNSPARAGQ
ncbi:MAG: hypothetical protein ABIO94_11725 [Opitutaceae bacterium]